MKTPCYDTVSTSQPVVLLDNGQELAPGIPPNTGSDTLAFSLSSEGVAVEDTVTWCGHKPYQVTDDVKCHGYYCRDCCQCARYRVVTGEHHAALWARKDMESARCEHFLGITA